ncbi:MAG: secretion protein F [Defluviitaleaceae bacterium]|nr:secretion protein F [Defluviitaleaceae bacterium]MCL2275161.1 secretion protein F [Defluviitaleaceae bacterium]
MLVILIPFFILFGIGLYFVLADVLKIPTLATTKAVIAVTRREKKQAKSFEAIIFDLAVKLSMYIKMNDYKKRKMTSTLKSADINLSPEVFTAKAIVKAGLILALAIPCLLLIPILTPIFICMAIAVFFKEYNSADEVVRKKREAIETELPRFVNTLTQELKASRDILSIFETYQKHAGDALRTELEITIADMKSGSHETALTRFEARMGSSQLSDVVRGLIAVMRGDNGIVYFQMLAHDLKQLEIQKLKMIAMKRPGKIKKYSFYMLMCFLAMYLAIIGVEIMAAFGNLF